MKRAGRGRHFKNAIVLFIPSVAMVGLFKLIRPAPLVARMKSRDACTYMFRIIKFIGWLPPEQGSDRYLYLMWAVLVNGLSIGYCPIGFFLSLVLNSALIGTTQLIGLVQFMLNMSGITIKSIILRLQFSCLAETMSLLDEMDERLQRDSDRRKIHKAVATCNYVSVVYGVSYVGYTVSMLVTPILSGQPPFQIYNPLFDWRKGNIQLCLQTLFEFTTITMAVLMNIVLDTYPIIYMIVFRTHIEILKDHIRKLRTDPDKTEAENYEELVNCIKYYKLIVKCCGIMRSTMSRTNFIQFMLIGTVLGLSMIGVMYSSDIFWKITSIIYTIALLLETFPFCFHCDLIVEDSNDLCNILGQSHWIQAERKYKSTLRIFMHQVQQPIKFIGFGIMHMSVNSNIKVAKFAFTVLTIVKSMKIFDQLE